MKKGRNHGSVIKITISRDDQASLLSKAAFAASIHEDMSPYITSWSNPIRLLDFCMGRFRKYMIPTW